MDLDTTYDVVVVGSGAAAMATAMGALDEGLTVLMLESTDTWGGNSAKSGGGMWLPDNPLMRADGVGDSREEALTYLDATVGDAGPATSRERKEAFVDGVADFVLTAQRFGLRFARAAEYADYYPERPGGKIGRSIEHQPFDLKQIGEWWDSSQAPAAMPIMTDDVWLLGRAWSTPSGFRRGVQLATRVLGGVATGKKLAGIGAGLTASFLHALVVQRDAELWLESPLTDLVVEDGRVVGVRITRHGREMRIGATHGVMLAGGGFDANIEWRQKYHGIDGNPSGAPGNLGLPIDVAVAHGAAVDLMDDAWWGASVAPTSASEPAFLVGERSFPYSIIVDEQGRRIANESESYVDLGHHMLEHDKDATYWMITDRRHTLRYLRNYVLDPKAATALREEGVLHKADTLEDLATRIGIDPTRLRSTVERFNGFARAGVDADFGRGNSAYDRYYSDPLVRPNPNLGPLEKAPFTAVRLVIGDLGTKGGVVTDAEARALREDGSVIAGLYSAGNNSASVMGRTYPGPGSTIGPAVVFGLRGARHLARSH